MAKEIPLVDVSVVDTRDGLGVSTKAEALESVADLVRLGVEGAKALNTVREFMGSMDRGQDNVSRGESRGPAMFNSRQFEANYDNIDWGRPKGVKKEDLN